MSVLLSSTTLEDFKRTLHTRYPYMIHPPEDRCNSFGFRLGEIQTDVDACYYGCSFTFGVGVRAVDCWTNTVDQTLNLKSNNFGVPGVGIEEIANVFIATTKLVNMKKAIFLLPDMYRYTMAINVENTECVEYLNFFANYEPILKGNIPAISAAKALYSLPTPFFVDRVLTSINLIEYVAKLKGISTYYGTWGTKIFNLLPGSITKIDSVLQNDKLGNDNMHPGPIAHKIFAQQFIEIIK